MGKENRLNQVQRGHHVFGTYDIRHLAGHLCLTIRHNKENSRIYTYDDYGRNLLTWVFRDHIIISTVLTRRATIAIEDMFARADI